MFIIFLPVPAPGGGARPQKPGRIRDRYYRQAAAMAAQVRGGRRSPPRCSPRRARAATVCEKSASPDGALAGGCGAWQEGELERGESAEDARRARLAQSRKAELDRELAAYHAGTS